MKRKASCQNQFVAHYLKAFRIHFRRFKYIPEIIVLQYLVYNWQQTLTDNVGETQGSHSYVYYSSYKGHQR